MPAEGFLQRFHDLGEADEEVRCRAAIGVRQDLVNNKNNAEDMQYAFRRLVRGVQSSRQCCRQGFSLALSELLVAFPSELCPVLDLIRQHTELQPGLKNSEMKDRLLGRLLAYAAVLQAKCLKAGMSSSSGSRSKHLAAGPLAELGKGLHEIFAMRPYLKAPAARMVADAASELVAAGLTSRVPELLEPWSLEEKAAALKEAGASLDVYVAGLLLELRALVLQAEKASGSQDSLKAWPACIRSDFLAKPSSAASLAQALGSDLAAAPLTDAPNWVVGSFVSWLIKASKQKASGIQDKVFPALQSVLFPEGKSSPSAEAQALRAFAELAISLRDTGAAEAAGSGQAAVLMRELFERMPAGLAQLVQSLNWHKCQSHAAGLWAQGRLVEAVGAQHQDQRHSGKRKHGSEDSRPASLAINDETRLAIHKALQEQKGFATMSGKYQKLWQQALFAPLTSGGVRTRCTSLLSNLASLDGSDKSFAEPSLRRLYADQLIQLALHTHAPDEVVLSALCSLMTECYFEPTSAGKDRVKFSFKQFCSSVGCKSASSGDDLTLCALPPVESKKKGDDQEEAAASSSRADSRDDWRLKLWKALSVLSRRTAHDQATKLLGEIAPAETADPNSEPVLRTSAYHGCMSDGSLWVLRLLEWWDFITKDEADVQSSPKKKRKTSSGSSSMQCVVPIKSKDSSLRQRCMTKCQAILSEPAGDASLPARQKNALCGLPLVLALSLLGSEDKGEAEGEDVSGVLEDLVKILEELPATPTFPESGKQRNKAIAAFKEERSNVLRQVPVIAAELFVQSNRLIKEAANSTWRELSEYVDDETLKSLCASVRDADMDEGKDEEADKEENENSEDEDDEEEDEDEEDEGEDGDEKISASAAAKIAKFEKATAALKAERAKEDAVAARKAEEKGDEDEEDDILLDGDEIMDQLMDDNAGAEGGLLAAFASSGLQGEDAEGAKMSKWEARLRNRREDMLRKFREVDLIETFVQKCGEKRSITTTLLKDLFEGLLASGRRAMGKDASKEEDDGKNKKKSKGNSQMQKLDKELTQRLAGVISKVLKQACRGPVITAAAQWHTASEWAEQAKALAAMSAEPQASAAGQRPVEVGAVLLYWFCSLHRARVAADKSAEPKGWPLATELLKTALQDWGAKKGSDTWCQSLLNAFAVRQPQVLLSLPWTQHVRSSRNMFIQREQIAFLSNSVLRGLTSDVEGSSDFSAGVAALCTDLLESTLENASGDDQSTTTSQRQKMRREVLRCLSIILKTRHNRNDRQHLVPEETCKRMSKVIVKVRDALPARQGEVFQLCLHVLRALNPKKEGKAEQAKKNGSSPKLKPSRENPEVTPEIKPSSEPSSQRPEKRAKKAKGFFGDM